MQQTIEANPAPENPKHKPDPDDGDEEAPDPTV